MTRRTFLGGALLAGVAAAWSSRVLLPRHRWIVWDPVPAPNGDTRQVTYNVYRRALSSGGGWVRLNEGTITETRFLDRSLRWGVTYSYAVSGVSEAGFEGNLSEAIIYDA